MTVKKLSKDGHYRRFWVFVVDGYECKHCAKYIHYINTSFRGSIFNKSKQLKSHTCQARIKELEGR